MAFCFKRKEAVPEGVRRLAVERIESALEALKDCRGPEAVHGVRKLKKLLKRVPGEVERLKLEAKGWDLVGPGLKTAYACGREAYLSARREPTLEILHDWRKRVKDLWYQLSLLRPMATREIDARADELGKLSEYLGDDHDLVMLQQTIQCEPGGQRTPFEPELFKDTIGQRRRELQSAALKLGEKVYAEAPQQFCHRLAKDWEQWRKQKKHPARN